MSKENPNWGASRIYGELLMLGFEVALGKDRSNIKANEGWAKLIPAQTTTHVPQSNPSRPRNVARSRLSGIVLVLGSR